MKLLNNNSTFSESSAVYTDGRPYKVYTALLTQSGTDAPVATVLENTIGDIVWSYIEEGQYAITLINAFPENKTMIIPHSIVSEGDAFIKCTRASADVIALETYLYTDEPIYQNNMMVNNAIEIRVYY